MTDAKKRLRTSSVSFSFNDIFDVLKADEILPPPEVAAEQSAEKAREKIKKWRRAAELKKDDHA